MSTAQHGDAVVRGTVYLVGKTLYAGGISHIFLDRGSNIQLYIYHTNHNFFRYKKAGKSVQTVMNMLYIQSK